MAKDKKGKKGKGKKKEKEIEESGDARAEDPEKVSEVDRCQYDIQILALDNKIKRLTEEVNQKIEMRKQIADDLVNAEKDKYRSISFLNEKLKRKTEEAEDVSDHLDGARREYKSSINGLLDKIETQKSTFEQNKQDLDDKILEVKNEIASLIHFQEVREDMEEHEVNLTKEVAAQKEAFQADLELLKKQDEQDLIRLRGEMIRQVNATAAKFRRDTDQLIPPTIKRAIRENHGFRLTLRKLNRCKRHLDDESAEIKNKMKGVPEKLHSLHLTEKDLAQQSHNKTYLIQLLRKKLQDTKNKLAHYRACEEEQEASKITLKKLREHLQSESNEFEAFQREAKRLAKELREHQDEIQEIENECVNIRPLLQSCVYELLEKSRIEKSTFEKLAKELGEECEIDEEFLNFPVGSLEPII